MHLKVTAVSKGLFSVSKVLKVWKAKVMWEIANLMNEGEVSPACKIQHWNEAPIKPNLKENFYIMI